MIQIIKSKDRHFNDFGWLQTYWLFSFSNYYDPENISHGRLRVFNDDEMMPQRHNRLITRHMEMLQNCLTSTLSFSASIN
jgi:hypothetical protein